MRLLKRDKFFTLFFVVVYYLVFRNVLTGSYDFTCSINSLLTIFFLFFFVQITCTNNKNIERFLQLISIEIFIAFSQY